MLSHTALVLLVLRCSPLLSRQNQRKENGYQHGHKYGYKYGRSHVQPPRDSIISNGDQGPGAPKTFPPFAVRLHSSPINIPFIIITATPPTSTTPATLNAEPQIHADPRPDRRESAQRSALHWSLRRRPPPVSHLRPRRRASLAQIVQSPPSPPDPAQEARPHLPGDRSGSRACDKRGRFEKTNPNRHPRRLRARSPAGPRP